MKAGLRREAPYIAFVTPAVILYTMCTVIPLILAFRYSFTNWDGYMPTYDYIGFTNYQGLLSDTQMTVALKNTFLFALIQPLAVTLLAIPLALVLNSKMPSRNFQRACFFFPSVPSALIMGYIWNFMLNPTKNGALNRIVLMLGQQPIMWLVKADLAMACILFVSVWATTGWHACIYVANLQTIPRDMYESAEIDGANKWHAFRYITFPMLAPSMTISYMLLLVGAFKEYALPYALTGGGPGYSTKMLTQIILERGTMDKMFGRATAMSVVLFILIAILSGVQMTMMRRREDKLQ